MTQLDRRQWMLAGTAAIASSAAGRWGVADAARSVGMTLGFGTYGMKTLPTERAIQAIRETGFDSIELCVIAGWDADSAALARPRRMALRQQLGDSGLRLTALMEHIHPENDSSHALALERLRLAAGVAHDLVPDLPPLVQSTLGGGKFEQIREPLRDRLGDWVQVADQTGIVIAIKPHRGGAVSQPADAVWLLEQLGRPARLRMVYDYSHYAFRDLPLEATIHAALPYTAHIAVKDAVQENERVLFRLAGDAGTIDYQQLLRLFNAGGYGGDVNCEVSGMLWNQPDYDPLGAARKCYQALARAFEQAGVKRRKS